MRTRPATAGRLGTTLGGEAGEHDVGSVGRHDHQRPVDQVLDEVLDAHRRHLHLAHLLAQVRVPAVQHLRAELGRDLRHGRMPQRGMLGQHVERLVAVVDDRVRAHLLQQARPGPG